MRDENRRNEGVREVVDVMLCERKDRSGRKPCDVKGRMLTLFVAKAATENEAKG